MYGGERNTKSVRKRFMEGFLQAVNVLSSVDNRKVYESVDGDSRLPQPEKRQGGVITEGGGGGGTGGAEFVMGMPFFLDDHRAVIIEFEVGIEGHTKINETVNDLDGVVREGGEGFTETPSKIHVVRAHALKLGGIEENHDFTFGGRKSHAVLETPDLGALDEPEEFGVGVCNEAVVIDEEKNTDKKSDEGGEDWNGEMRKNLHFGHF